MSPPVPNGIPPELFGGSTPPAGTPGTKGDTAQHVHAHLSGVFAETDAAHDDGVKHAANRDGLRGWTEAERVAFLRRAQQEGNR